MDNHTLIAIKSSFLDSEASVEQLMLKNPTYLPISNDSILKYGHLHDNFLQWFYPEYDQV